MQANQYATINYTYLKCKHSASILHIYEDTHITMDNISNELQSLGPLHTCQQSPD